MTRLGLERTIVDRKVYDNTVTRFRQAGLRLPTFAELADPTTISAETKQALSAVDPDAPHPANLFRVHWYNGADRHGLTTVPDHLELPPELTGVPARIVVALGNRFPMIHAHKVLAAYGCLAPRIVSGQFDPTRHKALWPSTGNYCRGGVAISRIMGCRGVAILPAGMSEERFRWLERWVADPADIVRTPGSESNVKEIYDKCAELSGDPENVIFNQFCEFGNYLVHYQCTGQALGRIYESMVKRHPGLRLAGFTSATGSAGTIGAGDYLKEQYGARIVAVEAVECPTLLLNGFGEHNIQGIGDKHVPLIHNVMNTDLVLGISDRATDTLGLLFNTPAGRAYLSERRGVPNLLLEALGNLGLSAICNVLAAIKTARYLGLGEEDLLLTVATDDAQMYGSEREKTLARYFPAGFDTVSAAEVFGQHLLGLGTDQLIELTELDRQRIFNLGYFTWVEQQGVSLPEFVARRHPQFWRDLRGLLPVWDEMITELNGRIAGARG
ncbi:MAG: pyridoxal-5'-phosphate-dependent protein subunit beta [Deltaproteobacteria bacterium]|nr:pyridoxal-5'-phosphate-dependent protein subunit beta [Deltaproteobacteria bacterium]